MPNSEITLSDYLFPGEGPQEAQISLKELLDIAVHEKDAIKDIEGQAGTFMIMPFCFLTISFYCANLVSDNTKLPLLSHLETYYNLWCTLVPINFSKTVFHIHIYSQHLEEQKDLH